MKLRALLYSSLTTALALVFLTGTSTALSIKASHHHEFCENSQSRVSSTHDASQQKNSPSQSLEKVNHLVHSFCFLPSFQRDFFAVLPERASGFILVLELESSSLVRAQQSIESIELIRLAPKLSPPLFS